MNEEERLLVAVPTNDGINIFPRMLGMAKYFYIFEIESGKGHKLIEKRPNPHEKTLQHLKTLDVYEIIKDCRIVVSARIGKKGIDRLEARGLKLVFKTGNLETALIDAIDNI